MNEDPTTWTQRMFSLRARLLGVKVIKRDEVSVTIQLPMWFGAEAQEKIRQDLEDGTRATGQKVKFTRYGRFIRVEADA